MPDIFDSPLFNPQQCWYGLACTEPAVEVRHLTPKEPIRLCHDHAEDFDDRVAPALVKIRSFIPTHPNPRHGVA